MRLKTYRSDSVEAALRLARIELGDDAVFLGSRRPGDGADTGQYEVSFAVVEPGPAGGVERDTGEAQPLPKPPAREQNVAPRRYSRGPVAQPLADGILARDPRALELPVAPPQPRQHWREYLDPEPAAGDQLERKQPPAGTQRVVAISASPPDDEHPQPHADDEAAPIAPREPERPPEPAVQPAFAEAASPADVVTVRLSAVEDELRRLRVALEAETTPRSRASALTTRLTEQGLDAGIIARVTPPLAPLPAADEASETAYFRARLAELCPTASGLGRSAEGPQIVALVGPAGAGKTTALAKLAVHFGVGKRRSIHLASLDPLRVGAVEELRAYGAILGSSISAVDGLESLPAILTRIIESEERPDLILLDTCGYADTAEPRAKRLATALRSLTNVDVHLAVDATTSAAVLRRTVDAYLTFSPHKLLFTNLDQSEAFGPIVNEAVRSGLPLSYFSAGPNVTADLEPASVARLSNLLLHGETHT